MGDLSKQNPAVYGGSTKNNSKIQGLLVQVEEIIQKSGKTGIVTVGFGPGNSVSANSEQVFDVDPKTLTRGYSEGWRALLIAKLGNVERAGIVVRTFTNRKERQRCSDGKHRFLPSKEIRGFWLRQESDRYESGQIAQDELFACFNTGSVTGEPLPPNPGIGYCDD